MRSSLDRISRYQTLWGFPVLAARRHLIDQPEWSLIGARVKLPIMMNNGTAEMEPVTS